MVPEADVPGLLGAVLSASLLIVFLVFRGRARSAESEARLAASTRRGRQRELFATVLLDRAGVSARGLILSGALHAAGLAFAGLAPYLFTADPDLETRRYTVRIMEFRMPAALVYTPPPSPGAKPARSGRLRAGRRREELAQARPVPVRPALQLPAAPGRASTRGRDAILQPDAPPELMPNASFPLPSAFLWSQQPAPPEVSRLVGALREAIVRPFHLPAASPSIQPPNREPEIGDLRFAQPPVTTPRPKLTRAPANVAPVALPPGTEESRPDLPGSPLPPGEPLNLVTILQNPGPRAGAYLLELGNRTPAAGPGGGPGSGGGASQRAGAEIQSPADVLRTGEPGTAPDSQARPSSPEGAAAPSGEAAAAGRRQPGVIIVQESGHDGGLEGAEMLSGRPVYTVYLDVPGSPSRWMMQYCLPDSRSRSFEAPAEGVIRILPRRRIEPPYPVQKASVSFAAPERRVKRLVLYAMVNQRGEVENIKLVRGAGGEADHAAIAALQRWSFRPALQGEEPVTVEALFGIPMP